MKLLAAVCFGILLEASAFAQAVPGPGSHANGRIPLADGWSLQSSAQVPETGDVISKPDFQPKNWYAVEVPTTVVAALVKKKVYPAPEFGMNLRSYPGMSYPIGENFSELPMTADSPFNVPWWYRKAFVLPAALNGRTIWLNFGGINYRANIWLNGKQIANSDDVAGAWRTYQFNITNAALPGKTNVLALQISAPTDTDLGITFVDWNPSPPDKNTGLWRGVDITTSGPVELRYPTVISKVESPDNQVAHLTVTALVKNSTRKPIKGVLKGHIDKITFSQEVQLDPEESKDVAFTPEKFAALNLHNPRLWWPAQMGSPNLYKLNLEFVVNGKVSDSNESNFGIREITSQLNASNGLVFSVNGKKILIRGGGWSPDMMLRENSARLEDEFRYVQDMGLNTIRLEGKLETKEFFDLADRKGVLIMAGWCCCDFWEQWPKWTDETYKVAQQSLRDQIYRLRSHPSLVMWLNGSDNPPPANVEQMYLGIEKELLWANPIVSSATAKPAQGSGTSGVKMTGPYEYVAPAYWLQDTVEAQPPHNCNAGGCGGAHGFNSETSMGPAVPPIESIREMLPKDHQWPIDEFWNYHAGGGEFKDIHVFTEALTARYGKADTLEDYTFKSQLMAYEGVRAMFEAYSRNKYGSSGVIQWMLNNAWPSMIWHLYDFYLRPGGGYFGAKKAMEALHPVFGYDDRSVWLVSSQYADAKNLKLTAKAFNLDMQEKFSKQVTVDAPADSTNKIFALPEVQDLSATYFLLLRVEDASGKIVGSNLYWLSTKKETLDWEKSNWWTTPTIAYADYTALAQLPKVKLTSSSRTERKGEDVVTHVTLENPGKTLAFFVRVKLSSTQHGDEILPVLWEDNYITLLPGEKREVSATYHAKQLREPQPAIEITGWNVD
jgi:exo-1,4-beta-D-glucosaminidase